MTPPLRTCSALFSDLSVWFLQAYVFEVVGGLTMQIFLRPQPSLVAFPASFLGCCGQEGPLHQNSDAGVLCSQARFVEALQPEQSADLWLVFHDEGVSLHSMMYTTEFPGQQVRKHCLRY